MLIKTFEATLVSENGAEDNASFRPGGQLTSGRLNERKVSDLKNSKAESADDYISPPVQRAARLLRHIAQGDSITNMTATARRLGINRTTLMRILKTLESENLIERRDEPGAGWRIGTGLIGIAAQAFLASDIVQISVPILTRLTHHLQLSSHLAILDGKEIVYLARRTPDVHFASNIQIGSRIPAYQAGIGRIILAYFSADRLMAMYARDFDDRLTRSSRTDLKKLFDQLPRDRSKGITWSDGEYEIGITSAAAAVMDAAGNAIGAIEVSGQAPNLNGANRKRQVEQALAESAKEISRFLFLTGYRRGSQS